MANKFVDLATLKFILNDVLDLNSLLELDRFSDHDSESIDMFLSSVFDFSAKELYPCFREMDENPAHFKDGIIEVHPQVKTIMEQSGELGLISSFISAEHGGLQLPLLVHTAAGFIQECANNHAVGYAGLTQGAAELILEFGAQELKDTYTPKMLEGKWGGTMCLTEPDAGSSLSDLTTSAKPNGDGSYAIKGQKIFISGGDHPYASNFVHLLLARIEGAPSGTKGISLFVVPKFRPDGKGDYESNDVITGGDYQKLGQKGYCTTHLVFGENDNCQGWVVGAENMGLKYMFKMMNGARIAVGRGGASIATAAYLASLEYAQERPQGRRVSDHGKKNANEKPTLIINHPDVRRMLLLQKCVSEGSLYLVALASKYYDLSIAHSDEAEREKYHLLLELLTPIVKTYPAEMGSESVSNGLQVLGGYGFCSEFVLQQYYRDIRIFSIYEGTTGIQSMDLLGRKVTMANGQALQHLSGEVMQTISKALDISELKSYADKLALNLQTTQKVLGHLSGFAQNGEYERYLADANMFMEFFSKIVMAWLWLDMAVVAKHALIKGDKTYSEEFYEAKIHAMKFYFKYELTKTLSLSKILMDEDSLTIVDEKEVFVVK